MKLGMAIEQVAGAECELADRLLGSATVTARTTTSFT